MTKRILESVRKRQSYVPPERSSQGVTGKIVMGSFWSFVGIAGLTAIHFVGSIVFARLLDPADFGILGMAQVFTYFVIVFTQFGFNASVVYRQQLDRDSLVACWWGNLFIDGTAVLICVVGSFAGRWAGASPEVPSVICLLALQFLLVSFGSINAAMMQRRFMFRQMAFISVCGAVVSFCVSLIGIRVLDFRVFGLVLGMLSSTFVMMMMQFFYIPWLPSLGFSWSRIREHASYGHWFMWVNVVTYVNSNADRAVIGTYLDKSQLGLFDYATQIPDLIVMRLSMVINQVLFPAFSSLQDDFAELRRVLLRFLRFDTIILYPVVIGMAVAGHDFVEVAYGTKWSGVVTPLKVFCAVGLVRILAGPLVTLCNAVGKPGLPLKFNLALLPLNAAFVWFGVKFGGVAGAAGARFLPPIFMLGTLGVAIARYIGLPKKDIVKMLAPALGCGAIMSVSVTGAHVALSALKTPSLLRLVLSIVIGCLSYVGSLAALWPRDAKELRKIAGELWSRARARSSHF